jgi:recombination protein RecT
MTTNNNNTAIQQPNNSVVTVNEKNISETVMSKIKLFEETGTLNIPKNYSAPNALRAAWLILQETKTLDKRPVLEVCTKESIANALLYMIVLGLNPVKRQCSFIAYGNKLSCQREYQGTVAIAKRHGVVNVTGCAVFKDDEFEYVILEDGTKKVTKHIQTIESIDTGIVKAAYATKEYSDGKKVTEVMSMSQIKKAWLQGPTKGDSPAHRNFPDEMAIKTVKNRLLKPDVNSSDDEDLFGDEDDMPERDVLTSHVQQEIEDKGNKTSIGFTDEVNTDSVKTNQLSVNEPKAEEVKTSAAPF